MKIDSDKKSWFLQSGHMNLGNIKWNGTAHSFNSYNNDGTDVPAAAWY